MMMKSIYAPISGKLLPLEETVDPVFSEKMLGDGYAIEPDGKTQTICSPISGKISVINGQNHAISITSDDGLDILLHVGVDTVDLNGQGFQLLTNVGKMVKAGDPLLKADFNYIREYATAATVFVIVTNTKDSMNFTPSAYQNVEHNDLLFTIH